MSALGNLGIDLTSIILYIVNFGIIVFFINKYMSGPLIDMLEKRRSMIKNNLSEAEVLKNEMSKQKMQIEADKLLMEKKLQEQEQNLIAQSQKEAGAMLKSAEEKGIEIVSRANEIAEKQKTEIISEAEKEIKNTVKKMVTYIVSNKIPENVIMESVDEAWEKNTKHND